jgi:hypothetical protein
MATVNLGSIKFKWKGTYSGATAYTVDDVVEYNGSSYICILASTGNLPTNATYFEQMSSAGTNGTDLTTTLTTQGDILYRDGSGLVRLGAGTSGEFLKTQGAGANPVWASAGGGLQSIQTFTSSGTYTKPSGINRIKVIVTGAGGGGGGGGASWNHGGGGYAGGTAIKIIDATSITTETVTVGSGGNGGTAGNGGSGGGTSSFGAHCSATGGDGGKQPSTEGTANTGVGSGGDLNIYGGAGTSAGGGASASDEKGGFVGGGSFWGTGSEGAPTNNSSNDAPYTAQAFGSGGGNGCDNNGGNNGSGANGADGVVYIEEYK